MQAPERDGVVTYGRPFAGKGTLAFITTNRGPALVRVCAAEAAVYGVVSYSPGMKPDDAVDDDDNTESMRIDMRGGAQEHCRINAPLPTCCVCREASANFFLWCRCTVPCVCARCARHLDKCPWCRESVDKRLPIPSGGRGNIGALQPECAWGTMLLFIKTLTGKTLAVRARRNDTVLSLKKQIDDSQGIPWDQQRMCFAGWELDNRLAISFYNIQMESTIHLILRMKGD